MILVSNDQTDSVNTPFRTIIAIIVSTIILVGCGAHTIILWPAEEAEYPAGSYARVIGNASGDSYLLRIKEKEFRGRYILEKWRVRLFDQRKDAEEFARTFQEYVDTYARNEYNALPIRREQSRVSDIVYRLKKGEIIKIIEQSKDVSNEAGFIARWYKVLTNQGTEGWVFGYYLTVFDSREGLPENYENTSDQIYDFLNTTWRPDYFAAMIAQEKIDSTLFDVRYGLFPNPRDNRILLSLPDREIPFIYDAVVPSGANQLTVRGTSLRVQLIDEERIAIHYMYEDSEHTNNFVKIDDDIQPYINKERARQETEFSLLLQHGTRWRNSRYGTIEFDANKNFIWYNRRDAQGQRQQVREQGSLAMQPPISDTLLSQFDGAITLQFADNTQLRFLYVTQNNSIRLWQLDNDDITDYIVTTVKTDNPIVFSYR